METNPTHYQLPSRVQLEELGNQHIGIHKVVKSRIIQKDTAKILETIGKIHQADPQLKVSLICTRNICSKSIALLTQNGIDIIYVD